jgi:hypothetical protein
MPPPRETDRLLQRIRTLVQESPSHNRADGIEPEKRRREIERLKTELAELVKQTAGTT